MVPTVAAGVVEEVDPPPPPINDPTAVRVPNIPPPPLAVAPAAAVLASGLDYEDWGGSEG